MTRRAESRRARGGDAGPRLAGIARDRRRGAHELAVRAHSAISEQWSAISFSGPPSSASASARAIARALRELQPSMAIFRGWAADWRQIGRSRDRASVVRSARQWIDRWRSVLAREPDALVRSVGRRLPAGARLLTLSRSSTLVRALAGLPPDRRPRRILVLESRPGGEGKGMARELRRHRLPARWLPDSHAESAVAESDLVLIGADGVEASGAIVHKVGTRAVARSAAKAGVPVVVVAGRSKWLPPPAHRLRLTPRFDRTPARWISAYWTDRGGSPGRAGARRAHGKEKSPEGRPPSER